MAGIPVPMQGLGLRAGAPRANHANEPSNLNIMISAPLLVTGDNNVVAVDPAVSAQKISLAIVTAIKQMSINNFGVPMLDDNGKPRDIKVAVHAETKVEGSRNAVGERAIMARLDGLQRRLADVQQQQQQPQPQPQAQPQPQVRPQGQGQSQGHDEDHGQNQIQGGGGRDRDEGGGGDERGAAGDDAQPAPKIKRERDDEDEDTMDQALKRARGE